MPSSYLDIMAVPKRHVLEQLALLASNEEEREKLLELASPEGADLYHEVRKDGPPPSFLCTSIHPPFRVFPSPSPSYPQYCYREKRPLVEVLQDFPSCQPRLQAQPARLLALCPRLRPRAFSIASSHLARFARNSETPTAPSASSTSLALVASGK